MKDSDDKLLLFRFTWCTPLLHIFDANGDAIFKIKGPCWHCRCCEEVPFKVGIRGFFVDHKEGEMPIRGIVPKNIFYSFLSF